MPLHSISLAFNGGEVTPYLAYLTNFSKHASSCARMENFLPMPFGGFRKRPGTLHLAYLPGNCRLETFTFSDGLSNVIAFHAGGMVIFDSEGEEVETIAKDIPDPFLLQFSQVNDVIDIVSPDFHPVQLSSDGVTWTLASTPFKSAPLLDENVVESHTLNAPGAGSSLAPASTFTLTSSTAFFSASHVGAFFQVSRKRPADDYERSLTATNGTTSAALELTGVAYFSTSSTSGGWTGSFTVQKSPDGSTWTDERVFTAAGDRNVPVTEIDVGDSFVFLRIKYAGTTAAASRGILAAASPFIRGIAEITAYTSPTSVSAIAITRIPTGSTQYWAEGAFSAFQGFPRAIAIHDRRRVFAGTANRPMSLWFSATDDLNNFQQGTEADQSFYRTLAATRQSPILWIASQRRLFVGTETGEWVVGADSDSTVSPESFLAREYTRFGSNTVPAIPVNDSIYFIERQGLRLRELAYVLERETFDAANLTRLAEHLPVSGITQMAFQHSREPMLWCIAADGKLLAFAYDRREDIAAWSRHTTMAGTFTSVAVLRNDSDDDDVFLVVRRIPDGGDEDDAEFHLEKFSPSQQRFQENSDLSQIHHVDSGVSTATTGLDHEVSIPAHLEGAFLAVLSNGVSYSEYVLAGKINLPEASTSVHAGLPIVSILETLPMDITVENGTTHSRRKRAQELKLNVFHTYGGSFSYDGQSDAITYTDTGDLTDSAPVLRTGWIPQTLPPAHMEDLTFSIRHTEPYPFLCRAAILSWTLHEP
jgi:hypothetical protein